MSSQRLPDGTMFALARVAHDRTRAHWETATRVLVCAAGDQVTLDLKRRQHLPAAAQHAGAVLEHAPLTLLLLLAYISMRGMPDEAVIGTLADLGRGLAVTATEAGPAPLRECRAAAQATLAAGTEINEVPVGRWNQARWFLLLGEAAWDLSGAAAAHWGTLAITAAPGSDAAQMRLYLGMLAGVMLTPAQRRQLSLPVSSAAGVTLPEIWWEYISLRMGPGTPAPVLKPDGLGYHGKSVLERNPDARYLALSLEQGGGLNDLARTLLAAAPRPLPRLLNQVVDIAMPHDLFPQLAAWEIAALRVQPLPQGMYAAALDNTGRSMTVAWWPACPDAAERSPLSFPQAAWALLHPVLAGIWHDLCADALPRPTQESPPPPRTAPPPPTRGARRSARGPRVLPPDRAVPRVEWAGERDREQIARACALGGTYRRLPPAWETRQDHAAFQRRRTAAATRAERFRYPPPPPGFTFVRPHTRGAGEPEPAQGQESVQVRPRGLFALALGLQNLPEADEEEH